MFVGKRFLIVDDMTYMRLRMRLLLNQYLGIENIDIIEAVDGLEAVSKYNKDRVDVVIMDIVMPKMDGLTALKAIRAIDTKATVIMVTGMGDELPIVEAIKEGACNYIVKPYDDKRVAEMIQKVLETL